MRVNHKPICNETYAFTCEQITNDNKQAVVEYTIKINMDLCCVCLKRTTKTTTTTSVQQKWQLWINQCTRMTAYFRILCAILLLSMWMPEIEWFPSNGCKRAESNNILASTFASLSPAVIFLLDLFKQICGSNPSYLTQNIFEIELCVWDEYLRFAFVFRSNDRKTN